MPRCINQKYRKYTCLNPCISCDRREKSCCNFPHELIDTSIILEEYLEGQEFGNDLWNLNFINKKFRGYITTIQVGHTIRRFIKEFNKLELKTGKEINKSEAVQILQEKYHKCMDKLRNFQILDYDQESRKIFEKVNKAELRMEDHDQINAAVAIKNKLNIRIKDFDFQKDGPTLKKLSQNLKGYKIKIRGG